MLKKNTRNVPCKELKTIIVIPTLVGVVAIVFLTVVATWKVSTEGGVASVGGSINLLLGRVLL